MSKYIFLALSGLSFAVVADDGEIDCDEAITTYEVSQCALIELEQAQDELAKYLEASLDHNAFDSELVSSIKSAQQDWKTYVSSHCGSIYTQWREGTIRGPMEISCRTRLTKSRTHEIWSSFLTYMDSTPPVLPEPAN